MRAATTRTGRRSRRSNAFVKAAVGSALLAALIAAPAHASGTPNVYARASTAAGPPTPGPGSSTWAHTPDGLNFGRSLTGADRAYEVISEVPELEIPFPGVWEISYGARTYVGLPSTTPASLYVHTALFNNGALLPDSEALTGIYGANQAAQDTIGQTFLAEFKAEDKVTLRAYRVGQSGNAVIYSNSDGRTQITAHWVSPK